MMPAPPAPYRQGGTVPAMPLRTSYEMSGGVGTGKENAEVVKEIAEGVAQVKLDGGPVGLEKKGGGRVEVDTGTVPLSSYAFNTQCPVLAPHMPLRLMWSWHSVYRHAICYARIACGAAVLGRRAVMA
eukprot:2200903-Rhodomonas_salina.4